MIGLSALGERSAAILSDQDLELVHAASLDVLNYVGMVFEDERSVRLLVANGAAAKEDRVLLPPAMVERAIALCPSRFPLFARDPALNVQLGLGRLYFTSGYGATFVLDLDTDQLRPARLEDVRQGALLADALDMVHYCLLPVIPQDVNCELGELAGAALLLATTTKHVGPSLSTVRYYPTLIELARMVAPLDGALPISLGCTTSSPLKLSRDSIARMRLCAERRIPFRVVSAPMSGATAPATLAGTLVQQNAEILGSLTLGQLMNPGTPLIYGTFASAADMRTGKIVLGGPELALLNAASAQLCRRYEIPLAYGTGGTSDSPAADQQAGAERMLTALYAATAGVEVIHDAVGGLLGSAMCFSPAQMVMDNEFCQMIGRTLAGIEVSTDTLALDVIAGVGPGGNYLAESHTVKHYRREHFLPKLMNRGNISDWYESDVTSTRAASTMEGRARERARSILQTHKPDRVDEVTRRHMEAILAAVGVQISL